MKRKVYIFSIIVVAIFSLSFCEHKSGRRNKQGLSQNARFEQQRYTTFDYNDKAIVKMESENGVKYIWVEINGLNLKFIFDTGASSICLSSAEATVLYRQGTLRKEDILNVQYFQTADGKVSAGTRINLRSIKIGDRMLKNIEAIVIDNNDAPLLLGQSALEKFGKISIDNKNNLIIFE